MLESELELQIWSLSARVYGPKLESIVGTALMQYRRRPGLDDPTRMYQSSMEPSAFQALARAWLPTIIPAFAWKVVTLKCVQGCAGI